MTIGSILIKRRGRRGRRGAAAVEFALVAVPFLTLLFALLEIMMIFFVQTTLEAAVADASRQIRTGQAQMAATPMDRAGFKTEVCDRMFGLGDCSTRLFVMVEAYDDQPGVTPVMPWVDGTLTPGSAADEPFQQSTAGQVVVVRSFYVWPLLTPGLSTAFRNFGNGTYGVNNRLLVATSAFRNEPF